MVNFTVIGEQWVNDPASSKGRKLITQYIMRNAACLNEIIMVYKNTRDGSLAIDLSTGDNYFLLGGAWAKLGG